MRRLFSGLLHHFHNSLGLLRPNPLPKVLLRHSLIHHRINGLVTDFRISFNPGLNSVEVAVYYY